jgi:hypothetical protein
VRSFVAFSSAVVNVGDPPAEDRGEWPETITHLRGVSPRLCAREELELVELGGERTKVGGGDGVAPGSSFRQAAVSNSLRGAGSVTIATRDV